MKANVIQMVQENQENLPISVIDELTQIYDMFLALANLITRRDTETVMDTNEINGLSYLFQVPLDRLNALIRFQE